MKYKPYKLEDVREAERLEKFTVVSTFAGGGGSSTGYRLAGGKILAINEFIPEAQQSYARNYPSTPILRGDIRSLSASDILDASGVRKGELDILDGSPPCSSFSMAGIREEGWGREKKYSSTKQRTDDLFFEFARILRGVQPRFFIAENVAGLTLGSASLLLGSEQLGLFGEESETIYHTLANCGYKVRYRVINAKYFGVPQSRARLIITGVRNDLDFTYKYPAEIGVPPSLRQAFDGLENTARELEEANIDRYAIGTELKKLKIGQQSDKYFSLTKMNPDRYAGTLTQSAGSISAASIAHWDNRKFTVSEAKRIMSFPDDYYLGETYSNQIERLGRAVPPLLMKAIVEQFPF